MERDKHFAFGKNWINFSKKIDKSLIEEAQKDLNRLTGDLKNKSFIDIGSGSGLHSLSAINLGAKKLVATDYDDDSVQASKTLINKMVTNNKIDIEVFQDDILNSKINEKFDVVYSWGVLHHTGNMWKAIENSLNLVDNDGLFVISIYVKNRFCNIWTKIKKTYTYGNVLTRLIMSFIWFPLHFLRKVVNGSIYKQGRGMVWFNDSLDWLGGYPYESATKEELEEFMARFGFNLTKSYGTTPSIGVFGSGCAEYVFKRDI